MAGKWIFEKIKLVKIYDVRFSRGKMISLTSLFRKTKHIFHSLGGCKTFRV